MTARVTSSASLSFTPMPTRGRYGASCGDSFSRSSVLTYSAVARVSRSASTRASGFDVGLATPILDTFSARHDATRRVRPLGIGHLALLAVATARHPGTPGLPSIQAPAPVPLT